MQVLSRFISAILFYIALSSAHASPFFVGGDLSGYPGDTINVALLDDNAVDFEAASIRITYDPIYLSFVQALEGDLSQGFSIVWGDPTVSGSTLQVDVSLASPFLPVSGTGSLMLAQFMINTTAPVGSTEIFFESFFPDYEIPLTSGIITILSPGPGPEPNPASIISSLVLFLSGLTLLAWSTGIRLK